MNVLVIGCGLLGRKIARTMDEMGWDVSVLSNIESDLELLENDFEVPQDLLLRTRRAANLTESRSVTIK